MNPITRLTSCSRCGPALLITIAALLPFISAVPLGAQATGPSTRPALSAEELNLLHVLESGTWRERRDAANALIGHGAWGVGAVTQMLAITKDPDAQARLQAMLRQMIHDRALGPSPITLHVKDAPAKAVYAELFRQAWAPLLTSPDNLLDDPALPKITLDVDHQPFWLALQQLARTTGLGLASQPDGYRLRKGAPILRGPVAISGPCLVVLTGIRPSMMEAQNYWIDFSIYAEPKVHLLAVDQNMQISQATDNTGADLIQAPMNAAITPDSEFGPQQFSVCLVSKNKKGGSLVRLKGTTTASIAVSSDRLDIPDLLSAKPQTVQSAGVAIHFLGCQKAGSVYQISFSCGADDYQQFQKINIEQPGWRLKVFDANGQLLPRAETVITNDGNTNQMTLIYGPKLYGKPFPEPKRLVWNVPREIQVVDVDVDFGKINLPLPGF